MKRNTAEQLIPQTESVRYRTFGHTGWKTSEIGLGTWSMGGLWGPTDDREAICSIQRAIELGVNFIDTAYVYGDGKSEKLIAKALKGRNERIYIATKVPPENMEWPARHDAPAIEVFSSKWIITCTERSLRYLKREAIDLQQLHVWAPRWLSEKDVWLSGIEKLKRQGKIRAFGISINDYQPDTALDLVASGIIDSVQVIYNIFEQNPQRCLFPMCQRHNVGVIVRVPFDEGSLTGRLSANTKFHPDDWREEYFTPKRLKEVARRVEELRFLIRGEIKTLSQAALKFCLSQPAVSTVIPSMRRIAHVEDNCAASDGRLLSQGELERLRTHAWSRNFYLTDTNASIFSPDTEE